jgi:hypothetical protein
MFLLHIALMFLVYIKLTANIARTAKAITKIPAVLAWIIFGPLYLIYAVAWDMFFYFKILCDSKEDDKDFEVRQQEDKL